MSFKVKNAMFDNEHHLIYKKSVLDSVKLVQDLTLMENAWFNITKSDRLEVRQETEGGCR